MSTKYIKATATSKAIAKISNGIAKMSRYYDSWDTWGEGGSALKPMLP